MMKRMRFPGATLSRPNEPTSEPLPETAISVPISVRPEAEKIPHIKRQHDRHDRVDEHRRHRDQRNERQDGAILPHIAETFHQAAAALLFFLGRAERALRDREHRDDQRDEADTRWRRTPIAAPHQAMNKARRPMARAGVIRERQSDPARPRRRFDPSAPAPARARRAPAFQTQSRRRAAPRAR